MNGAELLIAEAAGVGVDLSHAQVEQFMRYKDLLLEWNKKFNLTAITEERDIILKHFVDSLTAVPLLPDTPQRVIDVGAGAGFPGIPMKIARPDIELTLLDSVKKKTDFLYEAVQALGLGGTAVVRARAEEAGRHEDMRGSYDIAVSRAVAPLDTLVGWCLPFVKNIGTLFALKGPGVYAEADAAARALKQNGGELTEIRPTHFAGMEHYIAVVRKIK